MYKNTNFELETRPCVYKDKKKVTWSSVYYIFQNVA